MKTNKFRFLLIGLLILLSIGISGPQRVIANGFITFENGTDRATIYSTIPGLEFTTTDGQDWIYGDWRTGNYNGKYPDGGYTSNGNIFAWLGENQGDGRIDFTNGDATYLSVWTSSAEPIQLTAYYANGQVADTDRLYTPNINTGQMAHLTVTAPPGTTLAYVIVSGVANYWLIDDLSTDAGGVPNTRNPVIFVPGVTGSKLENDHNNDGIFDEVWPNVSELIIDNDDDSLLVTRLAQNGIDPLRNEAEYTSIKVGDIIRKEVYIVDVYGSTVEYFTQQRGYTEGEDFFVCPYDWRKDNRETAAGTLNNTLDKCINQALTQNPDATQVNVLAHSMGGIISRYYISDPIRARKVKRLITLGTPYLGAPKIALGILDQMCFIDDPICITHPETVHQLLQNFPAVYQIVPSEAYFQVYPDGYILRERDIDGDGNNEGPLNFDDSFALISAHNSGLAQDARVFQSNTGGWNNGGANGVEVVVMVGDGIGTPTEIIEYNKTPWYNPWASGEVAYRIEMNNTPPNGDGTVPLRSADTRYLAAGVDLTGGVPVFYYNMKHGELPKSTEVLQFAADIFESQAAMSMEQFTRLSESSNDNALTMGTDTNGLLLGKGRRKNANSTVATPRTDPIPINGQFITMDGPIEVEVLDSFGNRIGATTDGGAIDISIPGATYFTHGKGATVFLPNNDLYILRIDGQQEASTDIRIQKITNDVLTQTTLYDDLPTTENSIATLNYNPGASTPGAFGLDQDGNGSNDDTFSPSAILDPTESQDHESPETTISISGTQTPDGWYTGIITVTMSATDNVGGTGVAKIEYSLDKGVTVETYTGSFTVNADIVNYIMAKATDRAGNEEYPLAHVGLLSSRVYLPVIVRNAVSSITPTPTPTRTPTTIPSPTPTPTPTKTPTPAAEPFLWWEEAENGYLNQPIGIGSTPNASSCNYVFTVDDWSNGSVEFTFNVPRTGYYYPWTRAMGSAWNRNSFFVSFDNSVEFHFEIMPIGENNWTWWWQRLNSNQTTEHRFWLTKGTHKIKFRSRESDSRLDALLFTDSASYKPGFFTSCGTRTEYFFVDSSADDTSIREASSENMVTWEKLRLGHSDSRTGGSRYLTGFRLSGLTIPQDATISDARLSLYYADWFKGIPLQLTVAAEDNGNASSFSNTNPLLNIRPRTTYTVQWNINSSPNGWFESPNLAPLIQEVAHRPDWEQGNAIAIIISSATSGLNSHYMDVISYDNDPSRAAVLSVTFE